MTPGTGILGAHCTAAGAAKMAADHGLKGSVGLEPDLQVDSQPYFFFSGRFQPSIVTCLARASVSLPSGASLVMVEPAPVLAPAPILTGATSIEPEPMKALSPISVRHLFAPS